MYINSKFRVSTIVIYNINIIYVFMYTILCILLLTIQIYDDFLYY